MTYYKPLTPELRRQAVNSIDAEIDKLKTCQINEFSNAGITAFKVARHTIMNLPDGYPMPMRGDTE